MNDLEPPDVHHFNAAEGWLMLGNRPEALYELEKISPLNQIHPDVLEIKWQIRVAEKEWPDALEIASKMREVAPDQLSGYIAHAYALRRAPGGGLQPAWEALCPALERFPDAWIVPYNLACYACQLGQNQQARRLLDKALLIGNRPDVLKMALQDEDLKTLWAEIKEM